MAFYALMALLNAIISSILGLFVFFKKKKSLVNQTFFLFCSTIAIWSYSYFLWQIAITQEKALFWSRGLMVGAIFIPIGYLYFLFALTKKIKEKRRFLNTSYLIFTFFFLSNFTPLFVKNVVPKLGFSFWPNPGILYHPFILAWLFCAFYSVYFLAKEIAISTGIRRAQLKYVFIATVIGYSGGITNYLLWYDIPIPPIGNWMVSLYLVIIAYAIVKYRLMNIRIAIGRMAIYVFSFLSVIGISFSLVSLNNRLLQPISFNILGPLIIVIAVLLFQFFFRFFEKLASRYFYYTFYSYQKVISDLGRKLNKILDLKRLSSLIVDTLIKTMQLDRTVILMREENGHYAILRNIGFKEENGISLVKDNFLTKYLERARKPLVYGELFLAQKETVFKKEKENLEKLQKNMKKIEANLCLPLFREDKIIGVIVLGKKISRDPYSQEDIELLITLSTQASVALDNARLYEKIQDLSQNLQEKVDQQTRELREAYEKINKSYQIEKKAHQELKHLDEAKNQFIMATQHHLRTPLTIMKGYVSMILEGDYGKANKEIRKKLLFFQQSTEKLIRLVNEFLDISQFKVGKGVLNLQKVKVEDLVREIIKELKPEVENKGIYLKLEKPASLPFVQVDPSKFKEAIYNIIDNGVKYTEDGGVMINIKRQKTGTILIVVKDTGIGMSEEELEGLFEETFERSEGAKKLYALGRGIGLYIASSIIKAHRSKIWAESPGKGKGSTFYIELPIK